MRQRAKLSLLVLFLSVCCSAALFTWHVGKSEPPPSHQKLYELVCMHLRAFRHEDFGGAYEQASRGLQRRFSLVEFRQVIRTSYSEIGRSYRIELGPVQIRDNRANMQVFFVSENGAVQPCIYQLIFEAGAWKIDGARFLPPWPAGTTLSGSRT